MKHKKSIFCASLLTCILQIPIIKRNYVSLLPKHNELCNYFHIEKNVKGQKKAKMSYLTMNTMVSV